MTRAIHRLLCAALLALCFGGAAVNAAQAAAALDHACCHRAPAESSAAPDASPCNGFLPLTCCRAAGLPTTEPSSPAPPVVIALAGNAPIVAPPRVALPPPAASGLSPSSASIQRSVVLLI